MVVEYHGDEPRPTETELAELEAAAQREALEAVAEAQAVIQKRQQRYRRCASNEGPLVGGSLTCGVVAPPPPLAHPEVARSGPAPPWHRDRDPRRPKHGIAPIWQARCRTAAGGAAEITLDGRLWPHSGDHSR
eukprot:6444588-Prymnesium_polylepis.3